MKFLLDFLKDLFRRYSATASEGTTTPIPADNTTEPARVVTTRVLLVIYDPIMDPVSGVKLSKKYGWNRVDSLVNEFIVDILALSTGLARYQIVQRVEFNEFPELVDGFHYDAATYINVHNRTAMPHKPMMANYQKILTGMNVLPRIASRDIDEVWIFNFPYGGFYESVMGGTGAFWCNAKPLVETVGCKRKFIVMGFSYERGIGEMLESFAHRAESLLAQVFNCQDFINWTYKPNRVPSTVAADLNPFQRYLCFDQIAPGQSGMGTIHYAPNSVLEYEWDNPRQVMSSCYDWINYPTFQGDIRQVGPDEWGNSLRSHHEWWLKHLPRVAGRSKGIANNWWQYIMDPNLVLS